MKKQRALTGLLFISPWIIGFIAFVLYPLIRSIYFSFNLVTYSSELGYQYQWVGFENFKRILFEDADLIIELQNFVVRILLYVPVIIALSVIIAILLNQKLKGTGFFRLIFFLPVIILNGSLFTYMEQFGVFTLDSSTFVVDFINKILPSTLATLVLILFDTVLQILWYCGVPILIFLAGLQKINRNLYEAAQIDGASPWSFFWKITFPTLRPLISVIVVYIVVFLANFETNPIILIIMDSRFNPARREGYASAQAIIFALIEIVLIVLLYFTLKERQKGGRRG